MLRILLTGAFAFALSSASFTVASAAETPSSLSTSALVAIANAPVETAAEGGPISAAAIVAAKKHLAALDAAAPTEGADLAMWGVETTPAAKAEAVKGKATAMRKFAGGIVARSASIAVSLTRSAMRFLGVPYVFGGTSASGFDCSGYVQHVFAMLGMHLPRTADAQYFAARKIAGTMIAGDLVFFQTYETGPSHVGIYLGHDRFVHASSSHGVTVSSLHDGYWSARYLGAKRVVN